MKRTTSFSSLWPDYRPWALGFAALIGLIGFFVSEGLGESLFVALGMGLIGFLIMLLAYPLYWLIHEAVEYMASLWPARPSPLGKAMVREYVSRATLPDAADGAFGPGVRVAPPVSTARPEPNAKIGVLPGVRWLAERMSVWRDGFARREVAGYTRSWRSVDEAAAALEHGVRPAIQRLARELVALAEAANAVKEGEAMPEREAAKFEAALEHWQEVSGALRARCFPNDYFGDQRLRAILDALDDRLARTFEAYIRLANHPGDALRWGDAQGMVTVNVDFDCREEVEAFARWAESQTRSRHSSGFWWLVAAFAAGYWLGDD